MAVVVQNNSNAANANLGSTIVSAENNDAAIREANERAKQTLSSLSANGTPQQVIDALNLSIINFPKDSAEIPEDNRNLLKQAAEVLKKAPADTRIEIGGHTDSDGDDAHNQTLSEQRANAVRAELVKNGVNQNALSAKGYGKTGAKAANDTPEGRFQNRRIEYKISSGGAIKVTGNANAPN
jgi:outer membrane protein OmpA-like peptidoglycan-associated protein